MKTPYSHLGILSCALLALTVAVFLAPGCAQESDHADHDHVEATSDDHGHNHEAEVQDDHGHEHDETAHDDHNHAGDVDDEPHDDHDHADDVDDDAHDDHDAAHECVLIDPITAANLGIKVETIRPTIYYDRIKIPGIVEAIPGRRVAVATTSQVRVVSLAVPPHATVRPGGLLAELELVDPEIRDLQMSAVELRADLLEAQTERDRKSTYLSSLRERGAVMGDEVRRVETDLAVLDARLKSRQSALDATLSYLAVAGLDPEQLAAIESDGAVTTRVSLRAPFLPGSPDLEVATRHVKPGEVVEAGSPLYDLVALDKLQAVGEAFESDLPAVRRALAEGLPVTLLFPAENRTIPDLRIHASEGTLDGANRVTHFFVPFENRLLSEVQDVGHRHQVWENRAGARVQLLVATQEVGPRFVIPAAALVREGGTAAVFRRVGDDYERIEVRVEAIEGRSAILPRNGTLAAGDELVVTGALQVNLELQRQAGGAAAADPHAGHKH